MKIKFLLAAALLAAPANAGRPDSPEFSHRQPCYLRIDAGFFGVFYPLVPCSVGEPEMY